MADAIPHSVLSEQLQERIGGRRLVAAVFLSFQFDPGFFEQEILPVLLDVPVSHARLIRLLQLDDSLRARGSRSSPRRKAVRPRRTRERSDR